MILSVTLTELFHYEGGVFYIILFLNKGILYNTAPREVICIKTVIYIVAMQSFGGSKSQQEHHFSNN